MLDDKERKRKGKLLGARIATAITEEKTSDVKVAEACGVSSQAVWQWRASGKVDKFYLPILAHTLRRDISWFFVDEDDPIAPREVNEDPGKYSIVEQVIKDVWQMIHSGELKEQDFAALIEFARKFKRKT